MADIYGSHFEFGGISSRKYGLIIVAAESARNISVSGEVGVSTIFNKRTQSRSVIHNDYSNFPVSFDVDIITRNERGIMLVDRRAIEKWLFNRHDYQRLYIDQFDDPFAETCELIDGEQKRLYLNCRFVNPSRLEYNGGIVGYKVTLEADSGMWWQDAIQKSLAPKNFFATSLSSHTVVVDTDLDDYIYPNVSIVTGAVGGEIAIINATDDITRETRFMEMPPNTTIILDGARNYVNNPQYYGKMLRRNFPRLLDGENTINVYGNIVGLTFEFNNRRML